MPHIVIKSLKVGLWVILPLIFISNNKTEIKSDKMVLSEGSYLLNVAGQSEFQLQGVINFETAIKRSSKGKEYTILKLSLNDAQKLPGHSLGFFLSKQYHSKKIGNGLHEISGNIEGFLNYSDGIFGFANINEFGELPFFAKNGSVTIDNFDDKIIKGSIDVIFENLNEANFKITGNFIALKK
jgi:hypothetical protein